MKATVHIICISLFTSSLFASDLCNTDVFIKKFKTPEKCRNFFEKNNHIRNQYIHNPLKTPSKIDSRYSFLLSMVEKHIRPLNKAEKLAVSSYFDRFEHYLYGTNPDVYEKDLNLQELNYQDMYLNGLNQAKISNKFLEFLRSKYNIFTYDMIEEALRKVKDIKLENPIDKLIWYSINTKKLPESELKKAIEMIKKTNVNKINYIKMYQYIYLQRRI